MTSMHPLRRGIGQLPRYGGGWMHQFGHVYCLQAELLKPQQDDWFRALELWHTARHEGVALNSSHYGCIVRQCVAPAAWEAALGTLRQMRREAIRADVPTVGSAIAACAGAGQWAEAVTVLRHFESRGLRMDQRCYHACGVACAKGGQWGLALAMADPGSAQALAGENAALMLAACDVTDDAAMAVAVLRRCRSDLQPAARLVASHPECDWPGARALTR